MKDEKPTDYRGFIILGISLMGVGISLLSAFGPASLGFLVCGVVFMVIGLTNSDKWEKPKKGTDYSSQLYFSGKYGWESHPQHLKRILRFSTFAECLEDARVSIYDGMSRCGRWKIFRGES